jgi:hypothetical protein
MKNLIIKIDDLPNDITLNQIYILFLQEQTTLEIQKVNLLDLEYLQVNKYIKIINYDTWDFELRTKGADILNKQLMYYDDTKEVITKDNKLTLFIESYRKLFKATGVSGKTADVKTTTKKMEWFLKEYPDYGYDLILKATEKYINQESHQGFKYLQRCDYFISKEDGSKIKVSRLASYCEEIDEDYEKESDYGSFNKML